MYTFLGTETKIGLHAARVIIIMWYDATIAEVRATLLLINLWSVFSFI